MRFLLALLLSVLSAPAFAHKPSDSYLKLALSGTRITGQWDIALRDLDYALGLDADGDGAITWGELRLRHREIAAYALWHLTIQANDRACPHEIRKHLVDHHTDRAYAVLRFDALCPDTPKPLNISYRLFFDLDPQQPKSRRPSIHGDL
jgi:hypothetical protein